MERGLLQNRAATVVVGLALLLVSVSPVLGKAALSWLKITGPPPVSPYDRILIIGPVFCIFISASITCKSPFVGDRVVFGAIATSLLLGVITAFLPLAPSTVQVIAVAKSLLWMTAAIVSLVCLARCFMPSRQ
jgi:hypothetical protein